MSKITHPLEKKRVAYERDHYNRNGESNKAWRKTKPLKKAKARRAFRKANKDFLQVVGSSEDAPECVMRKQGGIQQRCVRDWGAIYLRKFVATRWLRVFDACRRVPHQIAADGPLSPPGTHQQP